VATANVQSSLPDDPAQRALAGVLALAPDLVGLQEWKLGRRHLLRESGSLGPAAYVGVRLLRRGSGDYVWSAPLLGRCVVGARAERFALVASRSRLLSWPGRAPKGQRRLGIEPPRLATVATYRDRRGGPPVSLVDFHLSPGVQSDGRYRADRPALVARHRAEVRRLQRLVDALLARGHVVYAVGDSNFDGFRLGGLTSGWEGRDDYPGTLGPRRKVDDVFSSLGPAASVTLLASDSDHRAVAVEHRPD
jgi:hypothetical protein